MTATQPQKKRNPYKVIKSLYVTEKAVTLQNLKTAESNRCLKRCDKPKYVFLVATDASKPDIAQAIETIYHEKGIKVTDVNTLNVKGKKRRMRGRPGIRPSFKKAVVTLQPGDSLDEQ